MCPYDFLRMLELPTFASRAVWQICYLDSMSSAFSNDSEEDHTHCINFDLASKRLGGLHKPVSSLLVCIRQSKTSHSNVGSAP